MKQPILAAILSLAAGGAIRPVDLITFDDLSAPYRSLSATPDTPLIIGNQYLLGNGPVTGAKFYRLRTP